jgi:hypothetical protein
MTPEAKTRGPAPTRAVLPLPVAIGLLVAGTAFLVLGSALAWGQRPLLGFSIGGLGTIFLTVGAITARNAMIGHLMEGANDS